ncbi:YciI family protein [Cellulomonas fengjieae]|uniref:YCII-related domain-containing protein n=1 Tax=Cellulomonas fengjieae TaxID=2819978 RepID=A0ABS3SL23_9CELL|nr:YciI family protein [Cellulomonas fengjieae]MBO3086074.1 hypothetical protein [Cellulomonas fengjieae]MBO3102523.1 hypothetical protein [Cellulomonas fengjieae]QVI65859.1 hypothetical protein KG102_17590 [Cellulomonas fengjieae]
MSHYLLSVMEPAGPAPAPEVLEPIFQAVGEVDRSMREAGIWVYAGGLHDPSTATVLRAKDGEVLTTDGPFVEAREHLGGFSIIDVDDLDAALDWGGRLALAAGLPIEVRPFRY